MIRPSVINRLRRGRLGSSLEALQPARIAPLPIGPLPDASMRVLEFSIACAALAAAVLLGLAR
ncbi:MAG TPA: hypothetical protein VET90_00570 [Candidatus Binatus sp.]|nr:hypothetical protein [Candidatus Binatus sp.]